MHFKSAVGIGGFGAIVGFVGKSVLIGEFYHQKNRDGLYFRHGKQDVLVLLLITRNQFWTTLQLHKPCNFRYRKSHIF